MRMRSLSGMFALLTTAGVVLSACGGGGGGGGSTFAPSANPTATATPVTSQTQPVSVSTTGSQSASFAVTGYSSVATIPAGSVATTLSGTFSTTQPGNTPVIQNIARRPQNIGASPIGALAFICIAPTATVTLTAFPSFTLTLPSSINGAYAYVAYYDPTNSAAGWTTIEGPASGSGLTLGFTGSAPGPTLRGGDTYCFLFFTLASALPTPTPTPALSASPTAVPTNSAAFTCPPNDNSANAVARSGAVMGSDAVRKLNGLGTRRAPENTATGFLAVTYSASTASGARASTLATAEQSAGGTLVRQFTFARIGQVVHVLAVPVAQIATVAARLRAQSRVESVAPTGMRRYATAVTTPYFPNDPYFNGFTSLQNTGAGNPAASTYQLGPYDESSIVPGQWDMHAIKLEDALAYGESGNGSGITNGGALGSSTVKIAIIDTGEDPNHPELASKIAYQRCFITNAAGTAQSTSDFETDPLGHGTDVSGIAAADTNNALGFTGTGGNVLIYAYRVFPTPDDNCANDETHDPQCGAYDGDIISAINDAVAQHVSVISISLGGSVCSSPGQDSDPLEGQAIENAIAGNVVVVAASGNSSPSVSAVSSPACDSGVIAVGATSLSDGGANPNGSGITSGTAGSPVEYVTTYTQHGSTNTVRSATSWGIVAPGGDPASDNDNDDLHWIENIWTTTPYQSSGSDTNFVGNCAVDYPGTASTVDCRVLIAGTSMATPHVAGAAALILSATGGTGSPYQSASAMKTLLCETADDLNDAHQGCGRLNVYTAMATALGDPSPPTPVP